MKTCKKLMAVFLTIATLIGIFSCATTVFAEEYNEYADNKAYQESLLTEAVEAEGEQSEIVCEVPEKRDEYSKTYKRADGSFTSVISKTPIHKFENGEWEEINNTLETNDDAINNIDGAFDVEFPETISENEQITVSNNGESIAFSVNGIEAAAGAIEEKEATEVDIIKQDLEKTVSQITYENVDENTDIQYIVSSNNVKENIIVKNQESLKEIYSFDIEKGNLSAELDNENNLLLKNDKNEIAFTIPAPVMTDADNAFSYDIDVSVKNADKSVLTLTYTPSKQWLENAKYPVVIDPVIIFEDSNEILYEDTSIIIIAEEPESRTTNYSNEAVGYICSGTSVQGNVLVKLNMNAFSFFKKPNLEVLDFIFYGSGYVKGGNALAKAINGNWDSKTITYDDVYPLDGSEPIITYDNKISDYITGYPSTESTILNISYFNITDIFKEWLYGERENNGFAIVPENDSVEGVLFLTGEYSNNSSSTQFNTYCLVNYVDTSGSNDSFEYLSQEIGRAGSANVNTFSRSLSVNRSDLGLDGLRMPVNIDFNYTPAIDSLYKYIEKEASIIAGQEVTLPQVYGNHWYSSYCFYPLFAVEDQVQIFTNEGTLVTFNKVEETVTETDPETSEEITRTVKRLEADETSDSGYELELIDPNSFVMESNIKLILPTGEQVYFNDDGSTSIREEEPNSDGSYDEIRVVYLNRESLMIDYITDGIGRKYDFIYNNENRLAEIKCLTAEGAPIKAGTTDTDLKVTYGYDSNGNLTTVTYPDGEIVTYSYDSNANLVKAQNIDGYNIQYTYDNLGKVTHIAEYVGTTAGNTIDLVQLSSRQVKVVDGFNGTETYQFGRDGRLHYTFDEKRNYLKSDYAPANDENVYSSNDWSISSQNLLKNGSFEEIRSAKALNWSNSFNVEDVEASEALTDYACRVSAIEATNALQSQTVAVNSGKNYTFSLYAKSNLSSLGETDRLYMRIIAEDEEGNETSKSRQITPTENFEQYSITISTETEISAITVEFGLKGKTGDFYVDNAQLEKGYGTAPFNYIKNGSFNNSDDNWTTATIVDETLNSGPVKAVKLNGGLPQYTANADETLTLTDNISATTQNVKINGKKGDTYSIGGWFKGWFDDNYIYDKVDVRFADLEEQLTNSTAQLKVTYSYLDEAQQTVTENFVVDFAPHNEAWQYAVDTFALKGDTESVDVTIIAKNIPTDCFATDIELVFDETSYILEDEELVTEDLQAEDAPVYYSDSETENTEECICEDCEEFNCSCRCTSEILCNCIQCKRGTTKEYDNYRNVVSTVKTDGVSTMETETIYSTDGNSLVGAKDENEVVSTFTESADKDTALPLQVSVAGRTSDYTFNTGTHLETVNKTVNGLASGNQMQVAYSYDNDRITKVTTNGYSYNFEYDKWGNIATEKVGNQTIANYYYGSNQFSKQLSHILYENGQSVRYGYDDLGNINAIKYSNDSDWRFTFDYTNSEKTTIIDNVQNQLKEITEAGYTITDLTTDQVVYSKTDITESFNGAEYTKTVNDEVYEQVDGTTLQNYVLSGVANSTKTLGFSKLSDWFGRETKKTVSVNGSALSLEKEFKYKNGLEPNSTTKYVEEISNSIKINDTVNSAETLKYTYDIHGNVKTVSNCVNDVTTMQYEYYYDEANQIVRVDDYINDITTTYQYDMGGNIVSAKEFARENFTVESVALNEDSYVYDSAWKDKVLSVNGKAMTYDLIGNLLTYDGKTHTWIAGRKLETFQNADYSLAFTYDENGLRSSKTVTNNGTTKTIKYIWVDGNLIGQTDGTDTLRFIYDDSEEIVGLIKNDSEIYLYIRNIFGDIIGIVDENGSVVVEYEYDVWGKFISVSGSLAETLGQLNPLRYRGYYYDSESGYYYLQSRYYDPELRRFINADKLENLYEPKNTYLYADSVNTFAYCDNSPVNMVDYSGEKKKNNTSNYLAKVLVFTIVLAGLIDEVVKIASDQILYAWYTPSSWIYNESQKGTVKIYLRQDGFGKNKENAFSDFLYSYYESFKDEVFEVLAILALEKFKEVFPTAHNYYYPTSPTEKRPFLFSDKCVKNEIKDHCLGYWYCDGKIKDRNSIRKFMRAYSIDKEGLQKHCQEIDIVEQDACDPVDRELFGYYNGIRKVYKNSLADPYWHKKDKRKENNVREGWKKTMIPTDSLEG